MNEPKLVRSESDKMFAGVCGGVAAYLGIDSVFVRLAFVVLAFASGIGVPLYIILMLIMPSEADAGKPPSDVVHDNIDKFGQTVSAGVENMRQHRQGPTMAAILLILFGIYFLLQNIGLLTWLHGGLLWPLVLIGLGIYLVVRRSRA